MYCIFVELPPFRRYLDTLPEGPELLRSIQESLLKKFLRKLIETLKEE